MKLDEYGQRGPKNTRSKTLRTLLGTAGLSILALSGGALKANAQSGDEDAAYTLDTIVVTGEKTERSLQETISSVGIVTGDQLEKDIIESLADSFDYIANVNARGSSGGFVIRGIPFDNLLGAGSAPLAQIYIDDVTVADQATRFSSDNVWDVRQIEVLRGAQSTVQGRNALAGAVIIRTNDPTFEWEGKARATYLDSEFGADYSTSFAFGGPILDDVLAFRVAAERRESDGFNSNPVRGIENADFRDQWQARAKLLFVPTDSVESLLTLAYLDGKVASSGIERRARDENGFTLPEVVPGNEARREAFNNVPIVNQSRQYNASLKTSWAVNDAWTLTAITAYGYSDLDEVFDTDGTNLDLSQTRVAPGVIQINNPFNVPEIPDSIPFFENEGTQDETQKIFSQELFAKYDAGGRFRALAGVYYVNSQEEEYNFNPGTVDGILSVVEGAVSGDVRAGVNAQLGGLVPPEVIDLTADLTIQSIASNYPDRGAFIAITSEPLDIENYAIYASGEYDVSDRITAGFGFRYDYEEQVEGLILSGDSLSIPDTDNLSYSLFPDPALAPSLDPVIIGFTDAFVQGLNASFEASLAEAQTSASQSFEAFLPSGFVRYSFDDDRSLAFSVRRGYRSGGADLNIPRQFVSQFDPEYTWNYELAWRSFWFDRSVMFNMNAFYTDWTDQQVVVSLSTTQQDEVGFNVGQSEVYGFEAEAQWNISPSFAIQGVIGYTKSEFGDFDTALAETLIEAQSVTAPIDLEETLSALDGRGFSFAPNWSGAVRLIYDNQDNLFGALGVTYEGASETSNFGSNSPTFLNNDERFLVNLTGGYRFKNATLSLYARNLLDEEYVSAGGNEVVQLGAPRQIGVSFQVNF